MKLVESEISGSNNIKKTFIIQKYIDKPLLYNKRKFDIRCYMLLVRLVHLCLVRMVKRRDTGVTKATFEQVVMSIRYRTQIISLFI